MLNVRMSRSRPGQPLTQRVLYTGALLALLIGGSACGASSGAFATRYPYNVAASLQDMIARAQRGAQRDVPSIATGVTTEGKLYAYDLAAKRVLWEVPARPRFAPLLAGDTVIIQEAERVVGLDLRTGTPRFQFDAADMHLVGADGVGANAAITLTSGQGTYARSRVVFMQGAARAWTHLLSSPVGVPALCGDVVLVPWNNQYLSGLDAHSGDELARLRVREGVISHAFVSGGQIYVGSQHGIALLSQELLAGNLGTGPHYIPPQEDLPGRPPLLRDAYDAAPLPTPESAQSRVRLSWESTLRPNNTVGLSADNLYLVFYRFVFALDPKDLTVRWLHTHEVDLVGARAQADGIALADARGALSYLAASSGSPLWREQNGPASVNLEFPADQNAIGGTRVVPITPVDLRAQLAAAAQDPDSRLVPVRLLAVQLLGKLSDPAATADLLALCEDDRTTVGIRKAACNALRERNVGNEHVLRALERHGSFLAATSAPPVGALAKAATTQKEVRAAPLLVSHLRDPNTPTQGLPEVVQALGDLGDASAAGALSDFLLLYHADPVDEHLARALERAPAALYRLQGAAARPALLRVAEDPLSADAARAAAQKVLVTLDEQQQKGSEQAQNADQAEAKPAEPAKPAAPKAPAHITPDIIRQALLPVHDPLQKCIKDAKPDVFQVRVVLVVEDGQVLMVSVLPEQLQGCIEPLVRSQPFPLTQLSQRDRVTYVIKRF